LNYDNLSEKMVAFRLAIVLLISASTIAQDIPDGTIIPVMLRSSLNAKKDRAGKTIEGKVMQEVRFPSGGGINKRSRVGGRVVSVSNPSSSGSRIVVKFDTIRDHGRTISVNVALLALASTRHSWLERTSIVKPTPNSEAGCPGGPGYDREQAFWIFSSSACGTYGFADLKVRGSGAVPPPGDIELISTGNVAIHGGAAWLLITVPKSPVQDTQ
jgi:hypothetical protein